MPADEEELVMALEDGVEFCELLAPVGVKDGILTCEAMRLGEADESGRRSPQKTGEYREIPADTVIAAIGEQVDSSLFREAGAELNEKGLPILDEHLMTTVQGLYAAGDGKSGPATVVKAIADAQKVAAAIAGTAFDEYEAENVMKEEKIRGRHGVVCESIKPADDRRCLGCAAVCETCMEVCPNRANIAVRVPGMAGTQILHVDGMCNECGNCAVFCPYEGRPYRDKFTIFWSREDFDASENEGFLSEADGGLVIRYDGEVICAEAGEKPAAVPEEIMELIRTVRTEYDWISG